MNLSKKNSWFTNHRSKGFAFVEFREHFHALAALRMLNNNPQYSDYSVGGAFTMKSPEKSRPRLIGGYLFVAKQTEPH